MSGASFGRKGVVAGSVAQPQPMGFGRGNRSVQPQEAVDPMEARRAAFLAEERARKVADGDVASEDDFAPARTGSGPVFYRAKSTGTAYVLWFFCGGISAHRFYLGYLPSAMIQLAVLMSGWMLVFSGQFGASLALFGLGGLWVLSDAFVIPTLVRNANERLKRGAAAHTFA